MLIQYSWHDSITSAKRGPCTAIALGAAGSVITLGGKLGGGRGIPSHLKSCKADGAGSPPSVTAHSCQLEQPLLPVNGCWQCQRVKMMTAATSLTWQHAALQPLPILLGEMPGVPILLPSQAQPPEDKRVNERAGRQATSSVLLSRATRLLSQATRVRGTTPLSPGNGWACPDTPL